jgi:hypothetical protein
MSQYFYDENGFMYYADGTPVTDGNGLHVQHVAGTRHASFSSAMAAALALVIVFAAYFAWVSRNGDTNPLPGIVPTTLLPVQSTPVIAVIDPVQTPVITQPEMPALPTAQVTEPVRDPRTGITPEGQTGNHDPNRDDARTP